MARRADIKFAFRDSIKIEPSGRCVVATTDFVRELQRYNHHWTHGMIPQSKLMTKQEMFLWRREPQDSATAFVMRS